MQRIINGSLSAQNLATYKAIATVKVPPYGTADYLLDVEFTGLDAGATLTFKDTINGIDYISEVYARGQTATRILRPYPIPSNGFDIAVSVKDGTGASTAAAWAYSIYRVDDPKQLQPQQFIANSDVTPIPFRMSGSGAVPVVTIRKPGGTFVAAAGTVTAVSLGLFELTPISSDTSVSGPNVLRAVGGTSPYQETQYVHCYVFDDATKAIAAATAALIAPLFDSFVPGTPPSPTARQFTIKLWTTSTHIPQENVDCWATTDVEGTNVVDEKSSDSFGDVTFLVEPGNYFAWADPPAGRKSIQAYPFTVPPL